MTDPEGFSTAPPFTPTEVVTFLVEYGLLQSTSVVRGECTVMEIHRRNANFKVLGANGSDYLVKHGRGADGRVTIENEATAYRHLARAVGDPCRTPHLPRMHHFDADRSVLVLELLTDARSLMEQRILARRASVQHARALGTALGHLHRYGRGGASELVLGQYPPWILSLHQPTFDVLRSISGANMALVRLVQQFPALCGLLDDVRQAWRVDGMVHGDLKADNCVVARAGGARRSRVAIVDWELYGEGDTAWDVGSVFNGYLSLWLLSIPITGTHPPDHYMELAAYPLGSLQPSFAAFWTAYRAARGIDGAASAEMLLRATRYCGAALMQTAYEQMQGSFELTGNIICLVQLAMNVMARPEEAAVQLMGISDGLEPLFAGVRP